MKKPSEKDPPYPNGVMWPQTLRYVGITLFGRQWRAHLARTLRVDHNTVNKWLTDGAPGWIAAHLEKVGYAKYDEMNRVIDNPDEKAIAQLWNCNDVLYSVRCSYRKSKGLPPPSLFERHKQVRNPRFPKKRR
jgi:hypothetical protein